MDFEDWIRDQLASGPLPPVSAPTPPGRPAGRRGRSVQVLAVIATFGVIGFGLASTGTIAPVSLQVEHSGEIGLPVTTWAGSPPAPSATPRVLQAEPAAALQASPRPLASGAGPGGGEPGVARSGGSTGAVTRAPAPAAPSAAPSPGDGHGGQPATAPLPVSAGMASPTPSTEDGGGHGGDGESRGGPSPSPAS